MSAVDNPPVPPQVLVSSTLSTGDVKASLYDEVKVAPLEMIEDVDGQKGSATGFLKSNYADWTRRQLIRKFWRMYLFGLLVSFSGLFAGYIDTAPGSVVANQGFIKQFGTVVENGKLSLDADYVSYWGVAQQVSTIFPQVLTAIATDRYGRRLGNWLYLGFACITIILEMVARNWQTWLVARLFAGITFGFIQAGPLTLMSEIVMPQMRGNVVGTVSAASPVRANASACLLLAQLGARHSVLFCWSANPQHDRATVLPQHHLFRVDPGRPLWNLLRGHSRVAARGRMEDAKKAHRRLIGSMDDYDFDHEFNVLVQEVEYSQRLVEAQSKSEWRAVFQWRNFRRVLIPVLPYAGQTLNGGAYINSYTTYFFQQAGLKNAFLASVITSLLGSAGIGTAMLIYDRVGRRPLIVWGTIGCAIGNYIIAGLAFVPISPSVGAGLITVAAIWQFISSISYGAVGWTAQVEITTPLLRAKSSGIIALVHGVGKILWNYTVPQMLSAQKAGWGAKCGLLFGGLTTLWFIPVYLYYPETRHRSFAALDDLFERRIPERKFHKTMTPYDTPEFERSITKRKTVGQWLDG
ncbi:hypothetical protein EHS25_009337 [Saitozyma podzolica]|uniref:Major facilitator superfamily (MFS) profile domain-containing protein n=1 Tax=Saitozyma podzolica TaxID=1890683 RepID=A0A427YLN5_9TREE|nr:hypothetical protein EHS25_009337 [Saitozyma podzolica]